MTAHSPMDTATSQDILAGIRVLDFSHVLAGPHCGRQLADLGAEVIKIESPGAGDSVRSARGARPGDPNPVFANMNAGKHGLAIDLKRPAGRELALELADTADVVIENFRPGVMRRLGLDYETLSTRRPSLVMCSISAFGQTGSLSHLPGFAYSATAMSGAMHLDLEEDGRPHLGSVPIPDFLAGLNATAAIAFALLHRQRTGRGQHLDISLLDCTLAAEDLATLRALNGLPYSAKRRPGVCVHRVGDGHVVITLTIDDIWHRFADAIGRPELKTDPRFVDRRDRLAHRAELESIIDTWVARFATRAEAMAFLEPHGVPCAPVLDVAEAVVHEHAVARGDFADVPDALHGSYRIVRSGMRFSEARTHPRGAAPATPGCDSRAVLQDLLGYTSKRIDALVAEGVLAA